MPAELIVLALIVFLCLALIWLLPKWEVDSALKREVVSALKGEVDSALKREGRERVELENSTRTTLAQILGGGFFLVTGYFTWKQVNIQQREMLTQQGQLMTQREQNYTERLNRAIEHLGDAKPAVRLGTIFELESIANISGESGGQKEVRIAELLAAYVRTYAVWVEKGTARHQQTASVKRPPADPFTDVPLPRVDIQMVLTVLGRRTPAQKRVSINLSGTDLRRALLSGAEFQNTDFTGTHLELSVIKQAQMANANLTGAVLSKAVLTDANLANATMKGTILERTDLSGADLRGTGLTRKDLQDQDATYTEDTKFDDAAK